MTLRALGYKKDAHDPRDVNADTLLGRPVGADILVPASLVPYRIGLLKQGGASSCVANALARAVDVSLRFAARGIPIHPDPPRASRRFMYFNGRWAENVGLAPEANAPPVADRGCYPRNAMRAIQKLGVCTELVFPYTDAPQEPGKSAIGTINEVPPPAAYRAAYDQMAFTYYRITSTGVARAAEVARALALGHPVVFGMTVDTAFMRWNGQDPIDHVDVNDPDGGGHMLCALAVDRDKLISDNWWDLDWGAEGYVHLTHRLFGSDVITDAYVIETAAEFSEEKKAS